jgi:23S rRNA (uracil1939-C5)-methyltransferase
MLTESERMADMSPQERLTTAGMATDGRAVARDSNGKVVFVGGALPGETVEVEMLEQRAHWSSARAVRVLAPSPDRVAPPCPRRAAGCGGCGWQHVEAGAQRRLKAAMIAEALGRMGGLRDVELEPTVELPPWQWRTSIRAGVVEGRAALRREHSHELVSIHDCLTAHPILVPLLAEPLFGTATSVVLRCGARTGERLVAPTPLGAVMDVPADVHLREFHEQAAGRTWRVSAGSFFQGRPDGADALSTGGPPAARDTLDLGAPPPGRRAVDAYCGVGLFAGVLADLGWSVTAVEGAKASVADARRNLAGLPVEVVRADVRRWEPVVADLVVADPSRAGLGRRGVSRLSATGASRLVLISCDVASLGRDAGLLTSAGFSLGSVTPVDMFPQTWHVEVVSIFDRRT